MLNYLKYYRNITHHVLGWQKISFRFLHKLLQKRQMIFFANPIYGFFSFLKPLWRLTKVKQTAYTLFISFWLQCIFIASCGVFLVVSTSQTLELGRESCSAEAQLYVESSCSRDQTHVPGIGRQTLNHQNTREVLNVLYLNVYNWTNFDIQTHPVKPPL